MAQSKPNQTTAAFLDAIEARDFELARTFLSNETFSYRSPLSEYDNADAFIENVSRVGPILEGIERRIAFVNGCNVCDILNFKTRMSTLEITPVVQLARVKNDKIESLEAFFDARAYAKMFDVD